MIEDKSFLLSLTGHELTFLSDWQRAGCTRASGYEVVARERVNYIASYPGGRQQDWIHEFRQLALRRFEAMPPAKRPTRASEVSGLDRE